MPFRGEYYALKPERRGLVNGLVYPVPDPRYPFLGVHITPRVDGEVLVGPNAVLALAREGYTWRTFSGADLSEIARTPAFWRFARQHWRTGIREMYGSLSKRRFIAAARAYVPEMSDDDVVAGTAGIRAQALEADGALVDDFRISIRDRIVVLRNAPSPAATSALAIAEHVVSTLEMQEYGESSCYPKDFGVSATPFDDGLDVDVASLRSEVASFAADGCDGLVALGVFGEAASLAADEADEVANTVASATDLPYVLGLSERDPDAVVSQARRLLDAVPRPPVALMAQIDDANPAVAAASLRRLYDATGIGILLQDYPVVSGISVSDEQVAASSRPVRSRWA